MRTFHWLAALSPLVCAAAMLAGTSAFAGPPGPPPGGMHRPPAAHRPAPPPPPSWHAPHYRPYYKRWDFWAPLTIGGIIATSPLWLDPPAARIEVVPVPVNPPAPAPAAPQTYTWYWCPTEGGFYPGVQTCPVPWEPVAGTSATQPPAPPQ